MLCIERITQGIEYISRKFGLKPQSYPTREEAIINGGEKFLENGYSPVPILNLPPSKKEDQSSPQTNQKS